MSNYAAVLQGALHDSEEGLSQLRANLISQLSFSPSRADHIIANLPVVLRDGMSKDEALDYSSILARIGGKVELFDQVNDLWGSNQQSSQSFNAPAPWESPTDRQYEVSYCPWEPNSGEAYFDSQQAEEYINQAPSAGLEIWTDDQNLVEEFNYQVSKLNTNLNDSHPSEHYYQQDQFNNSNAASWQPIISNQLLSDILPEEDLDNPKEQADKEETLPMDAALQEILAKAFAPAGHDKQILNDTPTTKEQAAENAGAKEQNSWQNTPWQPEVVAAKGPAVKIVSAILCLLLLSCIAFVTHSYVSEGSEFVSPDREIFKFDPSQFFRRDKKSSVEVEKLQANPIQDQSKEVIPPTFDPNDTSERSWRGILRVDSIQGSIRIESEGWKVTKVGIEVSSERADKLSVNEILQGVEHPWLRRIDTIDLTEQVESRTPDGGQVFVGDAKAYIVDGNNSGRQIAEVVVTIEPPIAGARTRNGVWRISRGISDQPERSVAFLERTGNGLHKMLIQGQFAAALAE